MKDYLWGGEKLKTLFGRKKDGIIAESWEVSVHKDGESTISGTNKTFAEYLKENKNGHDNNASIMRKKKLLDRRIFVCRFLSDKGGNLIRAPPGLEFELKNQISDSGGQNGEIRT